MRTDGGRSMTRNFEQARRMMVDGQVRTGDVTDVRIQQALRTLPREAFAPAEKADLAYADLELEVAPGRFLMRPRDLAKLLQALEPRPGDRALEIAGATGYGAAVLARMVREAIALEADPALSLQARHALDQCGVGNVTTVCTAAAHGWPDGAPYDLILVSAGSEIVPEAWLAQLADGGRLGVIVRSGPAGTARIYTRSGAATAYRTAFDAAPAVAPGLSKPKRFTF